MVGYDAKFIWGGSAIIAVLVGMRYVQRPVTLVQQGSCCTPFDREPLYKFKNIPSPVAQELRSFIEYLGEIMSSNRKSTAAIIIGTFASLAAAWSGATAYIPVAGPLLADTAGLTLLTVAMAYSLSALYKRDMTTASLTAFGSVAVGFIAGSLVLRVGASLIPIWGSGVNATTTFVLHAAIGWALVEVFEAGKSIDDLSASEWMELFKNNKEKAKREKEKYEAALEKLPDSVASKVESLKKKLGNRRLSDFERDEIIRKIVAIFELHDIDYSFD